MILQALTEYYRTLADSGKISRPGWGQAKVSYALCIGSDGALEQVVSVQTEQVKGKKTVLAPQLMGSHPQYVRARPFRRSGENGGAGADRLQT